MRERQWLFTTLLAGLCALATLGGCGSSGTKIVTVSSTPHSATSEDTTTTTKATSTATQTTKTVAPTSTSGGTEAPAPTRTATAPAFTHAEGASGSGAAAAVVREAGYTAIDTSDYHPEQTLTVLIGTRTGSGNAYDQQAFFFLDGKYIGTDTKQPSAQLKVVSQSDTEVTLAYSLYRPKDQESAGQAQVTFQLNNGKLAPLQPIPPATSSTLPSRL